MKNYRWLNQNNKGITLIALVLTIIILIILAGISINLILGDNGLLGKAKDAREQQTIESIREKLDIVKGSDYLEQEGKLVVSDNMFSFGYKYYNRIVNNKSRQ